MEPASEKPPKVEEPGGEVAGGVGQEGEGLIRVESVGSMELTALSAVPTEKPGEGRGGGGEGRGGEGRGKWHSPSHLVTVYCEWPPIQPAGCGQGPWERG